MEHIGSEMIALAFVTPVWFVIRSVRHHARQRSAMRAWQRELDRR